MRRGRTISWCLCDCEITFHGILTLFLRCCYFQEQIEWAVEEGLTLSWCLCDCEITFHGILTLFLRCCYFQEQVEWAVEEGADFIIGETFAFYGEAQLALDAILLYGGGKTILTFSFRTRLTAVRVPILGYY